MCCSRRYPSNFTVVLSKLIIYRRTKTNNNEFIAWKDFCDKEEENIKERLKQYCKDHEKAYVYGAGGMAHKSKGFISKFINIGAYVVSDVQDKLGEIDGIKYIFYRNKRYK